MLRQFGRAASAMAPAIAAAALLLLGACVAPTPPAAPGPVPEFARKPFEPFNRTDAVAIALREWRLFGARVDDAPPEGRPQPLPADKAERQPGLWQRVGEYWWEGLAVPPGSSVPREEYWTGKHDAAGRVFAAEDDGRYAWSAAFISYVMRIAGAGGRFPYSANHATYVNAAAAGTSPILKAEPPQSYAPQLGDLICYGRHDAGSLTFADLPTPYIWPGHCAMVVAIAPGTLSTVGGNVDDAVTMVHVPVTEAGMLAQPDGTLVDRRYPWFVVIKVLYDADAEPSGTASG